MNTGKNKNYSYSKIMKKSSEIENMFNRETRYIQYRSLDDLHEKKILHFGSGNTSTKNGNHSVLKNIASSIVSVDSDPESNSDFHSLEDVIDNDFDYVVAEHVFEHILVDHIPDIAYSISKKIKRSGKFLLTLPNIRNFGGWFNNFEHVNYSPPENIAAIIELASLEKLKVIDRFGWSKQRIFNKHSKASETELYLFNFLKENYNLEPFRYITYIFEKIK